MSIKTLKDRPERRYPVRLERVRRAGCEIATTVGRFEPYDGGHPLIATLQEFHIVLFTPFNFPRDYKSQFNLLDRSVRTSLHQLMISDDYGRCLSISWTKDEQKVDYFRDPAPSDHWDKALREIWRQYKKHDDEYKLCLDRLYGVGSLRPVQGRGGTWIR